MSLDPRVLHFGIHGITAYDRKTLRPFGFAKVVGQGGLDSNNIGLSVNDYFLSMIIEYESSFQEENPYHVPSRVRDAALNTIAKRDNDI